MSLPSAGEIDQVIQVVVSRLPTNILRVAASRLRGVRVGRGARIEPGARISRDSTLGGSCRIGRNAVLDDVQLAQGCTVGELAHLSCLGAGEMTHIETRVVCIGARRHRITIGSNCYVGVGVLLDHSSEISIGDYVHIAGPSAALHTHSSVPMALHGCALNDDRRQYGAIRIADRTWIGGNVTIYPGRTIGDHCVVLPNSVVAADVESYTMVGGVPAQVVRLVARENEEGPAGRDFVPRGRTLS